MAQVLAIDIAPHGEASGWRRGEQWIDALAYTDPLSAEEKQAVERLIEQELTTSTKRPQEYLKKMPPLPSSRLEAHPVLRAELDRVGAGIKMEPLDTVRYRLDEPPLNRRNDVAAWRAALDNSHSQLEHQYNRLLNLELLLQFGPRAWQAHIRHLEVAYKGLEELLAEAKSAVEETNRERKLSQMEGGRELAGYEAQWAATLAKNVEIEAACDDLERQVAELKAQLPAPEAPVDPFGIREGGAEADQSMDVS